MVKKYLPFSGCIVLLVLLLGHSWFGPDIWYHLTWGRSLIENHSFYPSTNVLLQQPIYANMYWLFQIVVYGLMQLGGIFALSGLFAVLWLSIAWLWLCQTSAGKSALWGPVVFLAFVFCAQLRFEPRPEVFSYFFLSIELALLTRLDLTKKIPLKLWIGLAIVQVLWTNCHGYFVLGPLLGIARLLALPWDRQKYTNKVYVRAAGVVVLLGACTLVSPAGWNIWQAIVAYTDVSRALSSTNQELFSPLFWPPSWPFSLYWIMWIATTGWSLWNLFRREQIFAAFCALGGALLALQAVRNVPLYLLLVSPVIAGLLPRLPKIFPRHRLLQLGVSYVASLIALVVSVCVVRGDYHKATSSLGTFGVHLEKSAYPIAVAEFLKQASYSGRIFVDSYDGGYLEYQIPELHPLGDSYFSNAQITLSYFAAIRQPEALRAMVERYQLDALLINLENLDVVESFWADPQWKKVFADTHRILFMRAENSTIPPIDFGRIQFYDDEDLTHWTYAFAAVTWTGIALKSQNPVLMHKLIADFSAAPHIPAMVIRYALLFALRTKDLELGRTALELITRTFERAPGERQDLDEVVAQVKVELGIS